MKFISAVVIACIVILAMLFFLRQPALEKKAAKQAIVGWRSDFASVTGNGKEGFPKGWKLEKKPGARPTSFSVRKGSQNEPLLHMEADNATGSIITGLDGVDLGKTPFLYWRWRVLVLPRGADGRIKDRDDQAIGIYVGTGNILNNKSISYRWDTETPRGAEGNNAYMLGRVKVKWFTLRNKQDLKGGRWIAEKRNVAEDFKKAWGFYPKNIYLGVCCNSQYTNSQASAELEKIEFVSPGAKNK